MGVPLRKPRADAFEPVRESRAPDGRSATTPAVPRPGLPAVIPAATDARPGPSRLSRRGLDLFVFFVADVQTGFGPFVAVYLTTQKWTQTDIGLVLTVSGLASLLGQIPAGALVDRVKSVRAAAAAALVIIGLSAFALAAVPVFPVVLLSRLAHAGASCVLGLSITTLSLNLAGRRQVGSRLGRNASFASIGTGLAAAGMGLCGYYLSNRAVFFIAAGLVVPALAALFSIRARDLGASRPEAVAAKPGGDGAFLTGLRDLARDRTLRIFVGCVILFHLANAAMLPLAASMLTLRSSEAATVMVAAAIVVPQAIVAMLSPLVGQAAQRWGRRPLLIAGFAALPLRGLLFALVVDPRLLVLVQALDGVSAAVLGVLVPLTIADLTRRGGPFNLAQGAVGCAAGVGAAISTTAVGSLTDRFGSYSAFGAMATAAAVAFVVMALFMPETADRAEADPPARSKG